MADTIKVTLAPTAIEVRPGAPFEVVVTIHNMGPTVEQYDLEIDGLPAGSYTLPNTRIALFPNDREEARVTILPSQEAGLEAGTHPFTLTVVARANPTERTSVEGTVRVAAAAALDAQLRPSRVTGRKARFTVRLRNQGNSDVDVDLDAYDSEEGCDFVFKPAIVELKPGQRTAVTMRVRPRHGRLVGPANNFDFQVLVQPSVGEARPLQGLFIYRPRFRSWRPFTRLVSLVAVAAVIVVAGPIVAPRFFPAQQVVNAQANVSMGNVKLGATNPNAVAVALGKGATMTNHDTVITRQQGGGMIAARLRQGQVVALNTTSPAVKLAGGIHVGSTIADVKKAFGASLAVIGGAAATTKPAGAGMGGAASSPTVGGGAAGQNIASSTAASSPTVPNSATVSGTVASSPTASGTVASSPTVSGAVMTGNALAGGTVVVVGQNTVDGRHPRTYFDLNKAGTQVTSIRMGVYPWIIPDHGAATSVSAITSTATWTLAGAPYLISGDVRITQGVTLTVMPGVHMYFTGKNAALHVDGGALHAIGTPDAPVVFTALDDQQHGALDTLNRPAPAKASWAGLGVTAAGGILDLNNTEVYYGSSPSGAGDAEIYVDGGGNPTVSVRNSTIEAAAGYALNAANAPAGTIIQGNIFNADNYPLLINGGLSLDDSNLFAPKGEVHNTHDAVYVRPGAIVAANGATVTWTQHKVPFVLQGDEMVGPNGTLELGPDVIVKGVDAASGLTVTDGTLVAAGQRGHVVMMTSYADDGQGGDSNGDGKNSKPRPGDWRGLEVKGTSQAILHRFKMWWAGSRGGPALGIAGHASVSLTRGEVAESGGDGIANNSNQPVTITNSLIHDGAGYGLNFSGSPDARTTTLLSGNKIARNAKGAFAVDGTPAPAPPQRTVPAPPAATITPAAGATPTSAVTSTAAPASTATGTPASTATATSAATDTATPAATDMATAVATATPAPAATDTATPAAGTPPSATSATPTPAPTAS